MTNDEISKYIFTEIMGGVPDLSGHNCNPCGDLCRKLAEVPDYTSDSSPRSLLNEVVARVLTERGRDAYDDALESVLKPLVWRGNHFRPTSRAGTKLLANQLAEQIVLASINPTAEQIARAAVAAHKGGRKEPNGKFCSQGERRDNGK